MDGFCCCGCCILSNPANLLTTVVPASGLLIVMGCCIAITLSNASGPLSVDARDKNDGFNISAGAVSLWLSCDDNDESLFEITDHVEENVELGGETLELKSVVADVSELLLLSGVVLDGISDCCCCSSMNSA